MSLRNRELLNLLGVGILIGLGFASVYIARQAVISTASLSYLAFFLGLFVAAHLVARAVLPYADPYLMPLAALLTGIGLTMIYRVDPDLALRQGLWLVIGARRLRSAARSSSGTTGSSTASSTSSALCAIILLVLPALPRLGATINGASLWVQHRADRVPAGRGGQGPARRLPRRVPARQARGARERARPLRPAAAQARRAAAASSGAAPCSSSSRRTTSAAGSSTSRSSSRCSTWQRAAGRSWRSAALLFALGAYGLYHVVPHVEERVTIWLHPWSDPADAGYQLVQSIYAISGGGLFGSRPRARACW